MEKMKDIVIKKTKKVYEGFNKIKSFEFSHRLFDLKWSQNILREIVIHKSAVSLLPYDRKKKKLLLIKQIRLGAYLANFNPWQIEIITGMVEKDEECDKLAIVREAKEEANLDIKIENLRLIRNVLNSSGSSNESTKIFFCETSIDFENKIYGNGDENIKVLHYTPQQAFDLLSNGKISSVNTIIALEWFKNFFENENSKQ